MQNNQPDKDKLLKTTAQWVLILQFLFFIAGIFFLLVNPVSAFFYFVLWTGIVGAVNLFFVIFLFGFRQKKYRAYVVQLILFPLILGCGGMFLAICISWRNG
ncbi:hypothetical protein [Flavobacterium psychrotrophum]|uniref:hypothetical protein n=1 Tax=Flavobacterium psychrotrophum TaxID=2294119 RepID=UPI000E313D4C|nr:hypothetical protein [Flavobacterium psychrotrophum]